MKKPYHWESRGTANPQAKLDADKVAEIKRRLRCGDKITVLAAEYGVTKSTISSIKNCYSWGWVSAAPEPADGE